MHSGVETKWICPALLGMLSVFQAGLAAGAPWGRVSYGGKHPARLPAKLRRISVVSSLVYAAGAAGLASRRTPPRLKRAIHIACTGLGAVGAVVNAISPSRPEKLWSIWSLGLGAAAWNQLRSGRRP